MTELQVRDTTTLVDPRTDSWMAVVAEVAQLATRIAGTELVPAALRDKPPAIAAAILYGREIGLPPMTALRSVYVVNGMVALRAETMRALVLAAGHTIVYVDSTGARCEVKGRRVGEEDWHHVTWTIDTARAANLRGFGWQNYPRAMLKARATAELCRDVFADVIAGFVALEEVEGDTTPDQEAPRPRKRAQRREVPGQTTVEEQITQTQPVVDVPTPLPPAVNGVPLPGEDGYDQVAQGNPPPVSPESQPEPSEAPTPGADDGPSGRRDTQRDTSQWAIHAAQRTKLHTVFSELGVRDRDVRLKLASIIVGRELESSNELTRGEAVVLIDTLEMVNASPSMRAELAQVMSASDPLSAMDELAQQINGLVAITVQDAPDEEPPE